MRCWYLALRKSLEPISLIKARFVSNVKKKSGRKFSAEHVWTNEKRQEIEECEVTKGKSRCLLMQKWLKLAQGFEFSEHNEHFYAY